MTKTGKGCGARFLRLHPVCSFAGCTERATEVDHIAARLKRATLLGMDARVRRQVGHENRTGSGRGHSIRLHRIITEVESAPDQDGPTVRRRMASLPPLLFPRNVSSAQSGASEARCHREAKCPEVWTLRQKNFSGWRRPTAELSCPVR